MVKPVRFILEELGTLEGLECCLRHSGRIRRCGRCRAPSPPFLKALCEHLMSVPHLICVHSGRKRRGLICGRNYSKYNGLYFAKRLLFWKV